MDIKANILDLHDSLDTQDVVLVAVSKTKPTETIMEAYAAGQRDFGENKVQELTDKAEQLPKDIRWHMIGHLQRNKVKYIVPFVYLIHSVDSLRLLRMINKEAGKAGKIVDCLIQIHIAEEDTKYGFDETELSDALAEMKDLPNVRIRGLMGMATFTDDSTQIRREFATLKKLFDSTSQRDLPEGTTMEILSMGMSGDYELAIEEGSTMVRIGSAIFGERNMP
ncbi:YggS family pyridoxal phosphate-dependent enzyme [Fulvivirga sedimenti]|uniref:Pyridoxal phosphate homeostasis protein n=1 Tax=Fulvivirga sedimenti TaxID=2879465 RepID=A0A9X1HMT5_9BACT|nr:YggS family pyridoxal phosphate-dependent enzyme [Fulvivirga sedimenti]MCA6073885.1 YggS family pyridoxal phosphate-dependent enzyme [Fulvivirga sedimenti]